MSVEGTMAILYAQTNLAAPLVNTLVVSPQASAAMSRVLAAEIAQQERQKVTKVEKTVNNNVSRERQGRGNAGFGSRRRRRPAVVEDAEILDKQLCDSPTVGNFLNIKV